MVTSVSTDRGRRQRLQSKSHIQALAPISVLPYQIPELGTLPSCSPLQREERRTERETLLSSFFADVWLAEAQHEEKVHLLSEAIFSFFTKWQG